MQIVCEIEIDTDFRSHDYFLGAQNLGDSPVQRGDGL